MDQMTEVPAKNPGTLSKLWRRARSRWWTRMAIDGAFLLLVFVGVTHCQTRDLVSQGAPAPEFSLPNLDGETKSLADYRGRKVLLAFWSPHCSFCIQELDTLKDIAEDGDVEVISIVLNQPSAEKVKEFGLNYEVLFDDRSVSSQYKVKSIPTLYVIDEQGNIKSSMAGYTTAVGIRARL